MPELDNFIHGLMQFRTWAHAQKQCIYRQRNECVLGTERCRNTITPAFTGRDVSLGMASNK